MQFERGQICQPDQRRQIIAQHVVNITPVVAAPDRGRLHPIGFVHGGVLLEKGLAVHAIGITLARERSAVQMRKNGGSDTRVIVDNTLLGESRGGIKNLFQVRELQMSALNFNARIGHVRSALPFCLIFRQEQNTGLILTLRVRVAVDGLTMPPPPTYFQTSALLARPKTMFFTEISAQPSEVR